MNSVFTTYKSVFDTLTDTLKNELVSASGQGKINLDEDTLKNVFALIDSHTTTAAINGWEPLQKLIQQEVDSGKKTTGRRKK